MFKKAERKRIFVKMALCGVSGSGKTYSALLLAQGLGGKIAMIDTENGSGELYSDLCEYDAAQLEPPFSPMKFINAIKEAEAEGYNVLIIDSLSHAWSGQGGILDMVDKKSATSRSGNSFTAWRDVTPEHNKLVDAILQCRMHVIVCMRSKTAYEMQENEKGKKTPVKVGLAPIQRDGMEYEFTIVFDIDREKHYALASKDRTGLFEKTIDVITPATGELIRKWVEGGVEVSVEVEAVKRPIRADKFVQVYSDDCMVLTKKGFESIKNLPVDTLAQMAAHQNYALAATAITDFLDAKAVAMTVDGSAEATEIDALVNELPDIEDQASKVDGPIG